MVESLPNPHDAFFRHSFARVETARQFLLTFLPAEVCAVLDLRSLHLTKESFVDADLKSSQSDLLFEVSLAGQPTDAEAPADHESSNNPRRRALVYVLFEHKSTPEPTTPLQLLRYMVRIWEQRQKQSLPLPPVIPVIVYHGVQEWTTARTLQELLEGPAELLAYTPDFVSHLIDLGRYNDDDLPQEHLTQAALLLLKYIARTELADRLGRVLALLRELLSQPDGLEKLRAFLVYVSVGTKQVSQQQLRLQIEKIYGQRGTEIMRTIAEEWVEEGREEGREEGLRAGIQAVVELRFPEGCQRLTNRLESIRSADRLSELLQLSRTAESIDDLIATLDQQLQ